MRIDWAVDTLGGIPFAAMMWGHWTGQCLPIVNGTGYRATACRLLGPTEIRMSIDGSSLTDATAAINKMIASVEEALKGDCSTVDVTAN